MAGCVLIDPGHGGDDPGATHGAVTEAALNLQIATRLQVQLVRLGVSVQMTRSRDISLSLAQRVLMEHTLRPACFVSLHCNAATVESARGWEVWTSPGDTGADPLATVLTEAVLPLVPELALRGDYSDADLDRESNFYVLRRTACPAVLCEMGFVSNSADRRLLTDAVSRYRLATGLAYGLVRWLNSRR